jgi:ribosomal protein S18 acetylase RimI-like enzyme
MKTELRLAVPEDRDFLFQLYSSTRMQEIAPFGWPAAQQAAFLRMQFNAQQSWYETAYAAAEQKIIEIDGSPIGRIMVVREPNAWLLIDISLLPELRGRGVGTELMQSLIRDCAAAGAVLRLQVLRVNPAQRLYKRLGFAVTGEDPIYLQMELRPASDAESQAARP